MRMLDSGLHLSVDETYRLIAQARRLRREYLRMSVLRLVSWIVQRWSAGRIPGERVERSGTGRATIPRFASPTAL
jgi:hypothetical protein